MKGEKHGTPYYRHFDMPGKSATKSFEIWKKHLLSKGFTLKKIQAWSTSYKLTAVYVGPLKASVGAKIQLIVSRVLKKRGWVTVTFTPPKAAQ